MIMKTAKEVSIEKLGKIKKVSSSSDKLINVIRLGSCKLVTNICLNDAGMPFVHDTDTDTVRTLAKMVWDENYGKSNKIVRPMCGNMECINIYHLKEYEPVIA